MARIGRNRRALGRRRPGVLELLFMASGASAVSLSDFQLITSSSVNFACILAYNTPIIGCSSKDFTQGNTCSQGCIAGLQVLEATLETVCDGAKTDDNSILGQALQGNLVDTVCPSGDSSTTTSSTTLTSKTSTVAIILTSTEKTIPSLTRLTQTTTSTSDETTSSTETPSDLSTIVVETSSTATSVDASPAQTSNSVSKTTDTTGAQQTAPSSSDKPEATRGGGSPFDATADNGSSSQLIPAFASQCAVAFVLSLLLLR